MKLNLKLALGLLLAALGFVGAGCGGVNTRSNVSPASFLLPGLIQNGTPPVAPASTVADPEAANAVQVAQSR